MSTSRRNHKQWRNRFHGTWRTLCAAHGNVELTPQLVQLARQQKAAGHGPDATAAGIYWGARAAMRDGGVR